MTRNVLLIALGSTARADCLAEAISRCKNTALFSYLSHANPSVIARSKNHVVGRANDLEAIQRFAREVTPDLAVISPEAPLAAGVVDALNEVGVPCAGPLKTNARLESSKSFMRNLLKKYDIEGSLEYHVFDSMDGVEDYLIDLGKFVVKPDGLTGGKGVKVLGDHLKGVEDAKTYCQQLLDQGSKVVLEEKLEGEEFSVQFFTDGKTVIPSPIAQDHKRAFEDDTGPNTGGMGSYSMQNHLLPFVSASDLETAKRITQEVAEAIFKETGIRFKGIMYGGFMLTVEGVKLIEYNVRFGDPEVMNILPLIKSDFVEVMDAIVHERLRDVKLEFAQKATVCKYAVPEGYPLKPKKGEIIDISSLRAYENELGGKLKVYLGSVESLDGSDALQLRMGASRAIACVGIADKLEDAERIAEEAVRRIKGPVTHRKDIGTTALVQKRVNHMNALRHEK
ncbi:phosphoribosylamine--glycine ligase [Candidatus Micrarchaeota archaeon]|nr:phosphoribosylamine--glycine ligase [Candidatus Micrarchaeota archaeon]